MTALNITLFNVDVEDSHTFDSAYVRNHWLPTLGPSSFAVLQIIHADTLGATTTVERLAFFTGLSPNLVVKTLVRAATFIPGGHIVFSDESIEFYLPARLPDLTPRQLARLEARHDQLVLSGGA